MTEPADVLARNAPILNTALGVAVRERWPVKTGADPKGLIDHAAVKPTTIAQLIALPVPAGLTPTSPRQPGVESTIYEVTTTLTAYKLESDGDYHTVLTDGNNKTMIAEIPDPAALDPSSKFQQEISAARHAFEARFQPQINALRAALNELQRAATAVSDQASILAPMIAHVNVPVTVKGIGFFDFPHGQYGAAPNQLELHPVLSIVFR